MKTVTSGPVNSDPPRYFAVSPLNDIQCDCSHNNYPRRSRVLTRRYTRDHALRLRQDIFRECKFLDHVKRCRNVPEISTRGVIKARLLYQFSVFRRLCKCATHDNYFELNPVLIVIRITRNRAELKFKSECRECACFVFTKRIVIRLYFPLVLLHIKRYHVTRRSRSFFKNFKKRFSVLKTFLCIFLI